MLKSREAVLRILVRDSLVRFGFGLSSWWIWISGDDGWFSFAVRLVPLESLLAGVMMDSDVLVLLVLLGVLGVVLRGHFGGGGREGGAWVGGGGGDGVVAVADVGSAWWLVAGRCRV